MRVEPKTTGITAVMPSQYTMRSTPFEWQTDPFIWIALSQADPQSLPSEKFATVFRDSIHWNEILVHRDHDDDNHQLWLTKRFAQARNLFTSMAYFRSCVIMHVKHNIINTKKAFKNVLIILSTLKYIINLSTLKYIII